MSSPAEEVRDYLDAAAVSGGATGWRASTGRMTESEDQQIVVTETPGLPAEAGDSDMAYPSLQVRVRGAPKDVASVRAKSEEVFDTLHAARGTIGGKVWAGILHESGPFLVEYDSKDRPVFAVNFRGFRDRS